MALRHQVKSGNISFDAATSISSETLFFYCMIVGYLLFVAIELYILARGQTGCLKESLLHNLVETYCENSE